MGLGESLKFKIQVDASDAHRGLTLIGDDLDKTGGKAKSLADELGEAADQIKADLAGTARASEALGQALGPELRAKFEQSEGGLDGLVDKLRKTGATFDDIEAQADDVAAAIRKIDEVAPDHFTGKVRESRGEVDELSHSARGANSALANMVGNTTQDLGALGGVVGSLGVGIGQMGEYAADAALDGEALGSALRSMAAVAGPIAALSVATLAVQSVLSAMSSGKAAEKAFNDEQVKQFTDAVESADGVMNTYQQSLAKTGEVLVETGQKAGPAWTQIVPGVDKLTDALGLLGKFGTTVENILPTLTKAGITSQQWTNIVTSPQPVAAMDRLRAAVAELNLSDSERNDILIGARAAQENYAIATDNAAKANQFFGDTSDVATGGAQDVGDTATYAQGALQALADSGYKTKSPLEGLAEAGSVARTTLQGLGEIAKGTASDIASIGTSIDHLSALQGMLGEEQAVLGLLSGWDGVVKSAGDYWAAQQDETKDTEKAYRDYRTQLNQFAQQVVAYAQTVKDIPEQKVTDLVLALEDGDINEIQMKLADLTKDRNIRIGFDTSNAGPIKFTIDKEGGAPVLSGGPGGPTIITDRPTPGTPPAAFTPADLDRILATQKNDTYITNYYTVGQDPAATLAQQREYALWNGDRG